MNSTSESPQGVINHNKIQDTSTSTIKTNPMSSQSMEVSGNFNDDILLGSENEVDPNQKRMRGPELEIRSVWYCFYSVRFWQFLFMMTFANFSPTFFSYAYKMYGEQSSPHPAINDYLLTWAASIGSGGVNGASRLLFGWLMDKASFRTIFGILSLIQFVNALVQYWAAWYPSLYFICIMANYMYLGGLFAIFPPCVQNVYGLKKGP